MDIKSAIEVCRSYGAGQGIDSYLETLQAMQIAAAQDELGLVTALAFRTVVTQGRDMLAPV